MTDEKRLELAVQLAAGIMASSDGTWVTGQLSKHCFDILDALKKEQANRSNVDYFNVSDEDIESLEETAVAIFNLSPAQSGLNQSHHDALLRVIKAVSPRIDSGADQ